jgi:membrane-associated protease RseP (regulator of RpoE activity)
VAFTGEELGLYGSSFYVAHPAVPLDRTAAMVNLDMLGRSRDGRVMVGGTGTAAPLDGILTAAAEGSGLTIRRSPGGFAPSDSLPFDQAKVPSLFFFAGMHPDYHRTTDTFEKLDYDAERRIAVVAAGAARRIADLPEKPPYTSVAADNPRGPRLGVSLAEEDEGPGALLALVMEGSPAAKAGLKAGDRVVAVGGAPIRNGDDLVDAIRSRKPGDEIEIEVRRGAESLTRTLKLAGN